MIHQKEVGQVGQTISHYAPKAHPLKESSLRPLADKILEKLGEVPNLPAGVLSPEVMASPRAAASLSIPPFFGGSGRIQL